MNKKYLYISVITLVMGVFYYLIAETIELSKYKRTLKINSALPSATFFNMDGSSYNLGEFNQENMCIIFFSTECPHCTSKLAELNKTIDEMNDITFLFISNEDKNKLQSFMMTHSKLKNHGIFLRDNTNEFLKSFGSSTVPNTFLYKKKYLIKNIKGKYNISQLPERFNKTLH